MAGEFGIVLRKLRRDAGLTLRDLSKETGIHHMQLAHYETGEYLPKVDKVHLLAKPLKVKAVDLATIIKWEREFRHNGRSVEAEKFLAAWLMNLY
jgi:transcriptional regulator with XRE-family HTH domain